MHQQEWERTRKAEQRATEKAIAARAPDAPAVTLTNADLVALQAAAIALRDASQAFKRSTRNQDPGTRDLLNRETMRLTSQADALLAAVAKILRQAAANQ